MTDKEAKERHPNLTLRTGEKYGRITLLEFAGMDRNFALYDARCDCGKILPKMIIARLRTKKNPTRSCGCLRRRPQLARRKYSESTKAYYFGKFNRHRNRHIAAGRSCDNWTIDQWYAMSSLPCYYCGGIDIGNVAKMQMHSKHTYTESELKEYELAINGIDRIDSSKGYTFDNCRPCCYRCNVAKSDQSESDFYAMIIAVAKHRGLCAGR